MFEYISVDSISVISSRLHDCGLNWAKLDRAKVTYASHYEIDELDSK